MSVEAYLRSATAEGRLRRTPAPEVLQAALAAGLVRDEPGSIPQLTDTGRELLAQLRRKGDPDGCE